MVFKSIITFWPRLLLGLTVLALCTGCKSKKEAAPPKPPFPMITGENLFAVDALDERHVWIVGFNSIIAHTFDGGGTWEMQDSSVTTPLCDVSFVTPQVGWISGRMGTILHTVDGGKHWAGQSSGTTRHLFGLFFVNERSGWAVGEFGTIIRTSDGGKTWESQGFEEDRIYNDVHFVDGQKGWVVGEFGTIYRTDDGGDHWERQECKDIIPVFDETEWETPTPSLCSVWFVDSLRGWASGMDGIIIGTEDGGRYWRKLKSPSEVDKLTLYKIAVIGNAGWVVGQKGTYLYSENGGINWEKQEGAINTKFWLRDLDFSDSLHGWAVGSRGTIIKTEDGGKNWRMLSGIPLHLK